MQKAELVWLAFPQEAESLTDHSDKQLEKSKANFYQTDERNTADMHLTAKTLTGIAAGISMEKKTEIS